LKNHQFHLQGGVLGLVKRVVCTSVLGAALVLLAACSAGYGGALPPAAAQVGAELLFSQRGLAVLRR
jgi:hypothetical protein